MYRISLPRYRRFRSGRGEAERTAVAGQVRMAGRGEGT